MNKYFVLGTLDYSSSLDCYRLINCFLLDDDHDPPVKLYENLLLYNGRFKVDPSLLGRTLVATLEGTLIYDLLRDSILSLDKVEDFKHDKVVASQSPR